MKPAPFRYLRPSSVDEVVTVLAQHRSATAVLAGGQSLLPLLHQRRRRPAVVVDLAAVAELDRVSIGSGEVELGALVGQRVPPAVAAALPLLAAALANVGHMQTRNRGTIAGSVAHGDPLAELPLALLVGGGEVELASVRGRRRVPIDDFLDRAFAPARNDDELVVATRWTRPGAGVGHAFTELAAGTTVAAAAALVTVEGGRVTSARVGVAGPADRPVVIDTGTAMSAGAEDAEPIVATAPALVLAWGQRLASQLVDEKAFMGDSTSNPDHRRAVALELATRALVAATADAQAAPAATAAARDAPAASADHTTATAAAPDAPAATAEASARAGPDIEAGPARETAVGPVGEVEPEAEVAVALAVDGEERTVVVESRTSLADALRAAGVTGVKLGCEQGVCGSCTVLLDGRSQRSCLVLAVQADEVAITTAAGLTGPIEELRAAFVDHFAVQCGFCASGVLVTAAAELSERERAGTLGDLDGDAIVGLLSGNVCRCTGYGSMVAAISQAAHRLAERSSPPAPEP